MSDMFDPDRAENDITHDLLPVQGVKQLKEMLDNLPSQTATSMSLHIKDSRVLHKLQHISNRKETSLADSRTAWLWFQCMHIVHTMCPSCAHLFELKNRTVEVSLGNCNCNAAIICFMWDKHLHAVMSHLLALKVELHAKHTQLTTSFKNRHHVIQ
jgi:hypothetical protein